MKDLDFYTSCHLLVAATRVLEYQKGRPPNIDEVCEMLSISLWSAGLPSPKGFSPFIKKSPALRYPRLNSLSSPGEPSFHTPDNVFPVTRIG